MLFITVMLLEFDESQHSERTVFIPPPDPGLNENPISYNSFKLNPSLMKPQKNMLLKNPILDMSFCSTAPGSPMARRTKHEIKDAARMARKQVIIANERVRVSCLLWFY